MALSIDGFCKGSNGAAGAGANPTNNTTLTMANAGNIVVICVLTESTSGGSTPSVSSISDGFNTYALRNRVTYQGTSFGAGKSSAEIWWAFSTAAHTITSGNITVTVVNNNDSSSFVCFGVTGFIGTAYQTNPWDQSAATALAFAATGGLSTSQTQLISAANVSTLNANTLLFAFGGSSDNSATVPFNASYATGAIAGTTATDSGSAVSAQVANVNAAFAAAEYRVLSATVSSVSAAFAVAATAGNWAIMPDALFDGSGGGGPGVLIAHG